MFKGLLYEPHIIRMNLRKTVIPLCILFPIMYGLLTSIWPLLQLWYENYSVPLSFEAVKDVTSYGLAQSVAQVPEYVMDCLFYSFVRNKFSDKFYVEKGQLI